MESYNGGGQAHDPGCLAGSSCTNMNRMKIGNEKVLTILQQAMLV